MPIRLALSTASCPDWPLDVAARKAREMGYAGLDLCTIYGRLDRRPASDPVQFAPEQIVRTLREAGIEPACLSTNIAMGVANASNAAAVQGLTRDAMRFAAAIGCGRVRVFAGEASHGESRTSFVRRLSQLLGAHAEAAGDGNVQLLLENGGTLRQSREWWTIVDEVGHPMVGLSWNLARAIEGGEKPTAAVMVLNSRIRLVKATDVASFQGPAVPVGDGVAGVQDCLKRLMGIGYDGWLSVEWPPAAGAGAPVAEDVLRESAKRLAGWIEEIAKAGEAAAPKAKPAKAHAAG